MQIADVEFFESIDGSGTSFFSPGSPIIAIHEAVGESASPDAEGVANLLDGSTATKYLNFGKENSGFIVTPSAGASVVRAFTITTANDFQARDPVDWELFGTNSEISTVFHGTGKSENWAPVATGTLALPEVRETAGDQVVFANDVSYTSYKWVCRSLNNSGGADSMQISQFQFDCDPTLNQLPLEIQKLTFLPNETQIQLDWTGSGGSSYFLYYSPDLVDWSLEVADSLDPDVDSPYVFSIAELPGDPKGFFRFVLETP